METTYICLYMWKQLYISRYESSLITHDDDDDDDNNNNLYLLYYI